MLVPAMLCPRTAFQRGFASTAPTLKEASPMKQPSRYELLRRAAERLEDARQAEKQGNTAKAKALQAEARELLQKRGEHSTSRMV